MTSKTEVATYEPVAVPDLAGLDWDGLVEVGRKVASAAQWLLGDLACQVETSFGDNTLGKYSFQIGIDYGTLRHCKRVSAAFPESVPRGTHPWSVYKVLAAEPDRVELVSGERMTVTQAQQIVADRRRREAEPARPRSRLKVPTVPVSRGLKVVPEPAGRPPSWPLKVMPEPKESKPVPKKSGRYWRPCPSCGNKHTCIPPDDVTPTPHCGTCACYHREDGDTT